MKSTNKALYYTCTLIQWDNKMLNVVWKYSYLERIWEGMCGSDTFPPGEIKLPIVINWTPLPTPHKKKKQKKNPFLEKYRKGLYIFMKTNEENKRIPNEKALRSVLYRNQSSVTKHCHRIPSYSLINFDE